MEANYMSDIKNYLMVHTTNFPVKNNKNGQKYIETYAMGTNFSHLRNTVHTTLNHIVESHTGGNWDNHQFVILSPMNTVIELNGNPAVMSPLDTFFSVDPDIGLLLPSGTKIIRPADNIPNGVLFEFDNDGAIYKSGNYSQDEILKILSMMQDKDKKR
jgi:hypothetical protein